MAVVLFALSSLENVTDDGSSAAFVSMDVASAASSWANVTAVVLAASSSLENVTDDGLRRRANRRWQGVNRCRRRSGRRPGLR